MNFLSFLKNGNTKKNNPKTIRKNSLPPHAFIDKAVRIPAPAILIKDNLLYPDLIPLIQRYTAKSPRNIPNGSDLNQPINPLSMIGTETENKSAATSPAVVPPIVLTTAKIATVVSEPIITGNSIVKLYKEVPTPKIW